MIEGHEVVSDTGCVAAGPEEAARIGAVILADGGNAMDAAAATCMACCMLRPDATGVGGYVCCALVLEGSTGTVWSVDGNSIAPAAAHDGMYRVLPLRKEEAGINENEYGCSVQDDANVYGPLAVGPPGMMAGMGTIWERWGRLTWPEVVRPSLDLLATGFPFGPVARSIGTYEGGIRRHPAAVYHLMPEDRLPTADDLWHRPDMEKTLERISSAGWRDFYDGEVGRKIADEVLSAGGIMTREDMASYTPRVTAPYRITYRNAEIYSSILPNGGISALQALHMMDCFDATPADSVEYWHRWAEVLKRVWRDRLHYLGDPDFSDVPVDRLLNPDYARGRAETILRFPAHVDLRRVDESAGGLHGTLHVSTADREGNVVSATISQGNGFGSCFVAEGTGVILGHGMCRLDPRSGSPNSVAPLKRPLNNTAPLMVRLPDRDVGMGLPGGRRLVNVNAQMAARVVDFGATAAEAALAPRLHVQTREPVMITEGLGKEVLDGLRDLGHTLDVVASIAGAAHHAEYLRSGGKVRAGGGAWAAGV